MLRTEKKVSGNTVSVEAKFNITYVLLGMLAIALAFPVPNWYMSILDIVVLVHVGAMALGAVFSIVMLFVFNAFTIKWRGTLAKRPWSKFAKGFVIIATTLAMMKVLGYDNAVYLIAVMYVVISTIGMYLRFRGV